MNDAAPTALAGQHLRLFALLVDYLLAIVLLNIADKLLLGAGWDLRPPPAPGWRTGWLVGGAALLVLRDALGGRSPGKWFTGIAAVRADDPVAAPSLVACLLRNLTLVLLPVEAVLVFTDPYCRRLGDRLAGTVVVALPRPAPAMRRLLGLAIVFLATTLAIFLAEFWNVRRSAAYPLALRLAAADPQVAAAFGSDAAFSAPALTRSEDGRTLTMHLHAEGSGGEGDLAVHLRLAPAPPHWEPAGLDVTPPEDETPRQEPAPPR